MITFFFQEQGHIDLYVMYPQLVSRTGLKFYEKFTSIHISSDSIMLIIVGYLLTYGKPDGRAQSFVTDN